MSEQTEAAVTQRQKRRVPRWAWWVLGGIFVFMAVMVAVAVANPTPEKVDYQAQALAACHNAVRDQLKSPSTADFGGDTWTGDTPPITMHGHVDAQNGFGATVRIDWACTYDGTTGKVTAIQQR